MDGNRRYAKALGKTSAFGHQIGRNRAEEVVEWCIESGIEHITLWALSTENWKKRSTLEQAVLFKLIDDIPARFEKMKKYGLIIDFIGDIESMPTSVKKSVHNASQKLFTDNPKHFLHIGLNYGGREEILHAIKALPKDKEITQEEINSCLYTKNIPDVELIIRTGGQKRLSGFMLWQSEYAEIYFSNTLWPDYTKEEFNNSLKNYSETQKNVGA